MRGFLKCWNGKRVELPDILSCKLEYTLGTPCDSFLVRCLWAADLEQILPEAVEFFAEENGETVFHGVVDEFECRWEESGATLVVTGRGMAALLLDNEAEAVDYHIATAEDILKDHVWPYGVQVAAMGDLPAVSGFSVATGASEWQVLYNFARYYGGVTPRFNRQGGLVLTPWMDGSQVILDGTVPVTELIYRERRYGVLSEILVRDKTRQAVEQVVNQEFSDRGGRCRRVLTMPGRSNYKAMRYSGEFQLQRSKAQRVRCEVTVPRLFFAWPGDLIRLDRAGLKCNGTYRVIESAVTLGELGGATRLVLGETGTVL